MTGDASAGISAELVTASAPSSCPHSRRAAAAVAGAYSIECLRELAKRRMPRVFFDFFDGGAEEEATLRDNRAAFARVRLAPRMLNDVASVSTETRILGVASKLPIVIAPTGAVGFGWPRGDVGIARAAAARGIPYSLSTTGTASIERIAKEAGGRLWFQAYIFKQRELTMGLIERARQAGYGALMVTVDLPVGGKRERDFRNDFAVNFRFTPKNVLDFATRPRWVMSQLLNGLPSFENVDEYIAQSTSAAGDSSVGSFYDPAYNWDDLKAMRDSWPGKLLVKGILRADDAERLAAIGCDGLIVSNHGGRQLDGAQATLDALPPIVRAVGGRMSVLLDSGVRRGADILKALALGAEAVMIGRATLYGSAAGGEAGAGRAIDILADELMRSMQLCGIRNVGEIGADLLAPGST